MEKSVTADGAHLKFAIVERNPLSEAAIVANAGFQPAPLSDPAFRRGQATLTFPLQPASPRQKLRCAPADVAEKCIDSTAAVRYCAAIDSFEDSLCFQVRFSIKLEVLAMICKVKVKNGMIQLPPEVQLPDGAEVQLTIPDETPERPLDKTDRRSFAERYAKYIGIATDLPSDFAENHDKYLYGPDKA